MDKQIFLGERLQEALEFRVKKMRRELVNNRYHYMRIIIIRHRMKM